ncbi:MAG: transposase [Armatimonadetes bacterium]|nr:transposase [Armatimonadota bacterium]MBS1726986.1 transposase [Armatimonadota bacterium]
MPQSLSQIIVHVVFSTKDRTPWLDEEIRPEVFAFLTTLIKKNGHVPIMIGGHKDHVHLLFGLSRTQSVADLLEDIKVASSKWLKTKGSSRAQFSWQRGYGAFGVSYSLMDRAIAYIANQDSHHDGESFKDEFRRLMQENGIDIDERYVWD